MWWYKHDSSFQMCQNVKFNGHHVIAFVQVFHEEQLRCHSQEHKTHSFGKDFMMKKLGLSTSRRSWRATNRIHVRFLGQSLALLRHSALRQETLCGKWGTDQTLSPRAAKPYAFTRSNHYVLVQRILNKVSEGGPALPDLIEGLQKIQNPDDHLSSRQKALGKPGSAVYTEQILWEAR